MNRETNNMVTGVSNNDRGLMSENVANNMYDSNSSVNHMECDTRISADEEGLENLSEASEGVEKLEENILETNNTVLKKNSSKKEKRPATISLKEKSEVFKRIVDIALEYEKVDEERKSLRNKVKTLSEQGEILVEELNELKKQYEEKSSETEKLRVDVEHREEAIDIVKADKSRSELEYKVSLGMSLKQYYKDFLELKEIEMSDDVGYAVIDTMEAVFKVLNKNGIAIE